MPPPDARDRRIVASLGRWFRTSLRDFPWRRVGSGGRRDPYRSLVSEAMLQQTQAARVAERFDGFLDRFPTVHALADADAQDVLAAWSGLGYYRRATNLHAAARMIVADHAGVVPDDPDDLLALPGVGRYTAGAVASMVFGRSVPLVDGNVRRVLMRLEGRDVAVDSANERWAWARAAELVQLTKDPGEHNEALMELGATVCIPRGAKCGGCPVARDCLAFAQGRHEEIPPPRPRARQREVFHACALAVDSRGRVLVERRSSSGLWADMWQAPTVESDKRAPTRRDIEKQTGLTPVALLERFTHLTTHRIVRFSVWEARVNGAPSRGEWTPREEFGRLALSSPQRRILLGIACEA